MHQKNRYGMYMTVGGVIYVRRAQRKPEKNAQGGLSK